MTDNAAKVTAVSFYALAIAIFISVSFVSIYHVFTIIAFLILLAAKEIDFKKLPASAYALLAFVAAQLLSAAVNFSELSDKSKSIGIIKYPLLGIAGLLIYQNKKIQINEFLSKHRQFAFNVFLATIIIAFIYGLLKVHSGWAYFEGRLEEMVDGHSNTRIGGFTDIMRYGYGSALVLLSIIGVALSKSIYKSLNTLYLTTAIFIGMAGLYLSYTRGAMLGFLICLPIVFFYFRRRLTLIVSAISFTWIAVMVVFSLLGGSSSSRFLMKSTSDSNKIRMSQYLSAIHAVQERPVFGFGPQQLKFHVKEIKEKYNLEYKNYAEHAHNVYLETAANSGIIGLLTFLAWLGLWLKELLSERSAHARQLFIPTIVFMLIAGQFEMLMMAQTSAVIYFLYAISHMPFFIKETTK